MPTAAPGTRICALPAFWIGLLYDARRSMPPGTSSRTGPRRSARRCATACRTWRSATPFRIRLLQQIAREALRISRRGLRARRRINAASQDETVYLGSARHVVATGKTVADELLERYTGSWGRNIDHVFEEFAF